MVSTRFYGMVSTALLVVGALAVGQAFHLTAVTGQVTYTSPAFVLLCGLGLVLILLGYRARRPVAEAWDITSDGDDGDGGGSGDGPSREPVADSTEGGAEFDPSMSPLGDAAPGDAERARGPDRPADDSGRTGGARDDGREHEP